MKKLHWFFKVWILLIFSILFWFIIVVILPDLLPTKKVTGEIRGIVFQNQIWSGTIFITGDLITLPKVKIIVESGTRVYINKNGDKNNFDLLPGHLQHGVNTGSEYRGILTGEPFWDEKEKIQIHISNLVALGNPDDKIVFTSAPGEGSPYDVNLIKIQKGKLSNVNFSNYRRLEIEPDVKITQSIFENSGDCAICISKGSPLILNNIFKQGKRNYLEIQKGEPLIKGNKFLEGEGDGIFVIGGGINQIRVLNNTFEIPSKIAIKILTDGEIDISSNNFLLGDIELPCKNKAKIYNNLIKVKIIFRNIGNCSGEYIVGENYWEIGNTENIISARISGISENFKVRIPRILKSPPKGI